MEYLREKWFYDYCNQIHRKNLEDIKKKPTDRIDYSLPETFNTLKQRNKSQNFYLNKIYSKIYQENESIINRITNITKRQSNIPKNNPVHEPKTLNFSRRKHFLEKIDNENRIFLKKLQDKESSLSVKIFDNQYKQVRKFKKLLKKKNFYNSQPKCLPIISLTQKKKKSPSLLSQSRSLDDERFNKDIQAANFVQSLEFNKKIDDSDPNSIKNSPLEVTEQEQPLDVKVQNPENSANEGIQAPVIEPPSNNLKKSEENPKKKLKIKNKNSLSPRSLDIQKIYTPKLYN
jgi:Hemingway/CFA97